MYIEAFFANISFLKPDIKNFELCSLKSEFSHSLLAKLSNKIAQSQWIAETL